jgi:hypothetical protein
MSAKAAWLVKMLINEQALIGIMGRIPVDDWKQWAKERPVWMQGEMNFAFEKFNQQKWMDSLNMAPARLSGFAVGNTMNTAQVVKRLPIEGSKKVAEVKVAASDVVADTKKAPKKCRFADLLNCLEFHTLCSCKIFAKLATAERDRIMLDNKVRFILSVAQRIQSLLWERYRENLHVKSLGAMKDTVSGCTKS